MTHSPDPVATIDYPDGKRWLLSWRLLESDPRLAIALLDGWEIVAKELPFSVAVPVVLLRWDQRYEPPVRW